MSQTVKPYACIVDDDDAPPPAEVVAPLSEAELTRKAELEAQIADNLTAFFTVGRALKEIQELRLYRNEYPTFDDYCADKLDISRGYAYRQIGAATVIENLLTYQPKNMGGAGGVGDPDECRPMVDISQIRERHVRPLVGLSPQAQVEAWDLAVTAARERRQKLSGQVVAWAARQYHVRPAPPPEAITSEYAVAATRSYLQLLEAELKAGSCNIHGLAQLVNDLRRYVRSKAKFTD